MESWKSFFLITAVLLVPAASASASGGWLIDANAGIGIPTSDFGKDWKSGLLMGASAAYALTPQFAVGVDGSYVKNDPSNDYAAILKSSSADDEFKLVHYGAHGKWIAPATANRVSPYLVAGVGLYSVKNNYVEPTFSVESTQTAFGLRGGVGFDWMIGSTWGLAFEGDYHHVMIDKDKFGYKSAPFIGVTAGIHWALHPGAK
ncbi:MAG: porin family protein [Candidatus Eisenbacteria bacterium]|uniref:Porin family protein n=1 Tax=Eiseniibacteriota bacterium TaxID=2212470 RepID=A0A538T169_UNCEI|nr:MAG: porin family protein [Candidatus Eisenbacteria bacterium]